MKYFVTGATGFIGGHVVRQLVETGHEVAALVRSPEEADDLVALGVEIHAGDITDKASMRAPMAGVDGVYHIAAWYKIGARDKGKAYRINVEGTRHVLELMQELDIPKGVYTSTVGVFSDTGGQVVDETHHHTGPFLSEYERTKWLAHYQVAAPMMAEGLPLVVVMPGLVYGPGDTSMAREALVSYLKRQLPIAPQETGYCWAHVEDTARGHNLAMEKGTPGESYIIAGPPHSFIEALELAEDITGVPAPRLRPPPALMRLMAGAMGVVGRLVPLPPMYTAESLRGMAGVTYYGSNEKAKRELGYSVRPLREGLRETLHYELEKMDV